MVFLEWSIYFVVFKQIKLVVAVASVYFASSIAALINVSRDASFSKITQRKCLLPLGILCTVAIFYQKLL